MRKGSHFRARTFTEAADPEVFAERALGFTSVLADASSLIVLSDIGALAAAHYAWRLATIAAAAAEAGNASTEVTLIDTKFNGASPSLPTDRKLVESALKSRLPLLSEDRKVLMAAEARGLDCFDVLIALELLSASGALTPKEYTDTRACLLERNAYRSDRLSWAQAVGAAAAKLY